MAKGARKADEATNRRGYWSEQLDKARKQYENFQTGGDRVVDRYRIEKGDGSDGKFQDRYNILYSSTETIRPSLYAQTPKAEVQKRHRDRANPTALLACELLEQTLDYTIDEVDFDEVLNNCVEDYTLPGLGNCWVRYEPYFKPETDEKGEPVTDEKGEAQELIDGERIALDYVNWKDQLYGPCRHWAELPWGARRLYFSKTKATKRFGKGKADRLQYVDNSTAARDKAAIVEDRQAIVWEIWSKADGKVIWYSDGYDEDVLDIKDDPLKLKGFFPFPKPLRAISNTRSFIPRPFYSQYQAQAEELDNLTARIRHLTNALQVRGVYDSSVNELQHLLSPMGGNKMIAIQNWTQFIGQNGIQGSIQWVPIRDIVAVLMELYKARDICKAEIYEITGFSDIVRGQSKASETLGAQQIKTDWASARLRVMQKEVQRFIREILRIMGEIAAEHFSVETFALYGGFEPPPPDPAYAQQAQAAMQAGQPVPPDPTQQAIQQFRSVVELLKSERERCAKIDIETDSTILPDEQSERKDRLEFLGQMGAFLQQAGPMVMQYPDMRGPLGAMMMFTARTFRASRPLEQAFEQLQQSLAKMPAQDPNAKQGQDSAAKAASAEKIAQIRVQADTTKHDKELAFKASEADKDRALEQQKLQAQAAEAQVQLQIKEVELQIKQAELALKRGQAQDDRIDAAHSRQLDENDQQHRHDMDRSGAEQGAYEFDAGRADAEADRSAQIAQEPPGGA